MRLLSLFTGGGMGDFGFMASGMEIVGQVEIEDYCQKILALRYPDAHRWKDIKNVTGQEIKEKCGTIDIITGGFPCQPFSYAGKKNGTGDNRYLWPEMLRIIKEVGPRWVVGENVPGIIDMALAAVCADLAKEGYEVPPPVVFPSHALGADHKRDRIWIVAYRDDGDRSSADRKQQEEWSKESDTSSPRNVADTGRISTRIKGHISHPKQELDPTKEVGTNKRSGSSDSRKDVANAESQGSQRGRPCLSGGNGFGQSGEDFFRKYWSVEPPVGRVVNGCTNRIHRLKLLGNGQTPACTYAIGSTIMDIERTLP